MAVPSYNTEQELMQLQTLGMTLHPSLVVLQFLTNDIEPRGLRQAGHAVRRPGATQLRHLRVLLPGAAAAAEHRRRRGAYRLRRLPRGLPRLQSNDRSLTETDQVCGAAGIPFAVLAPATEASEVARMKLVR